MMELLNKRIAKAMIPEGRAELLATVKNKHGRLLAWILEKYIEYQKGGIATFMTLLQNEPLYIFAVFDKRSCKLVCASTENEARRLAGAFKLARVKRLG